MSGDPDVRLSKFLALVLRHDPAQIGLQLDAAGWADIDALLRQANAHGSPFDEADLRRVVASNSKQRYTIDDASRRIRANQGHSIEVDLGLEPVRPRSELYHGTAAKNIESIRASGIKPMRRQYVQLTDDRATALEVGRRHGPPVVLIVDAIRMHADGLMFFISDNGVWLTKSVPPQYLA